MYMQIVKTLHTVIHVTHVTDMTVCVYSRLVIIICGNGRKTAAECMIVGETRLGVVHGDPSEVVEVTAELKVLLRPFGTKQQDHHEVHNEVKGQDGDSHDPCSLQCIQAAGNNDGHGEIAEPGNVEDQQTAVQDELEPPVLYEVDLPHLPQYVQQEDDAVSQIQPTGPGLVSVSLFSSEWKHSLLNL